MCSVVGFLCARFSGVYILASRFPIVVIQLSKNANWSFAKSAWIAVAV